MRAEQMPFDDIRCRARRRRLQRRAGAPRHSTRGRECGRSDSDRLVVGLRMKVEPSQVLVVLLADLDRDEVLRHEKELRLFDNLTGQRAYERCEFHRPGRQVKGGPGEEYVIHRPLTGA